MCSFGFISGHIFIIGHKYVCKSTNMMICVQMANFEATLHKLFTFTCLIDLFDGYFTKIRAFYLFYQNMLPEMKIYH